MTKYIIQRLIALIITLFLIMTIAFLVVRLMPGSFYDNQDLPETVIQAINAKYHFDKPLIVQYFYFIGNILHWDWGTSIAIQPNVPVFDLLKTRVPISLQINLISLFISIPIGIAAGSLAAIKKNTLVDHFISFMVVIFISVPSFIFATALQYFLAYKGGLFPIIYDAAAAMGTQKAMSMFLPVMALTFSPIARVTRYLRAELAETMNSEFLLLARTKGLTYRQAIMRHGMRNSFLPLANIIIPMFTNILGGSLVIERIFSIPGMGGMMIDSISVSDHSVTIAILMFYSFISLVTMLIVDISYGIIDPRIRVGGRK
ncbi:ABC transporter permease [Fusibacter ferrireducens]|uniref:ABC transporter permease n=1 Tax=Fusibacter ferrireducens TaxID=2785058 RepID=A0ABR9ZVE8_9FIRM|nr:ABC transporter permease [Fusibacter ferrireducens]MBF4694434.1 ABC transporter permease [Fusibacter ferrireducens]